jgi:hypothetical protein
VRDPIYVTNPFDDAGDLSAETVFQQRVLLAILRQKFKTTAQKEIVKKLEKKVRPLDGSPIMLHGKIQYYPEGWINECLKWAQGKNEAKGYPIIGLDKVMSAIKNTDRLALWIERNTQDGTTENRSGYD